MIDLNVIIAFSLYATMTITIYILECENGKYYVGRSVHPKNRILAHFNRHGSEWTKKYKPIRIIATFVGDAFDEEKWTLKTMETYGIDNVRGGSYTTVVMNATDKAKAQQTIRSLTDKCYKCGSTGHFATDCNVVSNDDCSHLHTETMISDNKRNYCDSDNSDNDRFPEEENLPEYITKDSPLVSDDIGAGMFQRKRAEAAMRNELTQFAIGERGMVVGLVQAAVHNGKKCTITGIMDETQRVRVRLDGGTLEIDIKPVNIHRINADARQPLSSTRCDRNYFSSALSLVLSREPPAEKGMHPLPIGKPDCLNDLTFSISGILRSLETDEVSDLIKSYGGRITSAVSNKTSFLILGKDGGKLKIEAAAKYGTKIIDEQQLFDMIAVTGSASSKFFPSDATSPATSEDSPGLFKRKRESMHLQQSVLTKTDCKKTQVENKVEEMEMEVEETIEAQNVKLFAENQKLQQKLNAIKTIICDN